MGTLQKPRDPYRGAVESQTLKGVRPDIVHEPELRRVRMMIEPPDGCMSLVLAGSDSNGLGVTELALSCGGSEHVLEHGEPGIPIAAHGSLRFVAVAWMSDDEPAGQWTLEAWLRRGSGTASAVATFSVNTTPP